jgi:hypothetical protein
MSVEQSTQQQKRGSVHQHVKTRSGRVGAIANIPLHTSITHFMSTSCLFTARPYLITLRGEYIHPLFRSVMNDSTMAVTYTRNESLPLPSSVPPSSTPTDVQSRRSPSSFDGNEPTRISSRIRKEAVYDFNRPVVLHESVEEKSVAADNVLFEFGFVMCDADSLW